MGPMSILVIDNYDSFTFNLCNLIAEVTGGCPLVKHNDEITIAEIEALAPQAIVLSPGPGHPSNPRDFGVCTDILQRYRGPVLGVCLGHQGIAHHFGGVVIPAPQVSHGVTSPIYHDGSLLFHDIPPGFQAVRYHSFTVAPALPIELERIAWSPDGEIMALRHRTLPFWGVQFHPESILTEHGARLIRNFLALAGVVPTPAPRKDRLVTAPIQGAPVRHRQFDFYTEPEHAYCALFAADPYSFWLDSSLAAEGLARYSFIGGSSIPGSSILEYDSTSPEPLFDYLDRRLAARSAPSSAACGFHGGFVGYFGYELKAACGYPAAHRSPLPDAVLMYAPIVLAFDYQERTIHAYMAPEVANAA